VPLPRLRRGDYRLERRPHFLAHVPAVGRLTKRQTPDRYEPWAGHLALMLLKEKMAVCFGRMEPSEPTKLINPCRRLWSAKPFQVLFRGKVNITHLLATRRGEELLDPS
jgi:hypothetical protein